MIAAASSSAASSAASTIFSHVLSSILFGNFNPEYNREARRRMRYIQQKFAMAYSSGATEDANSVIHSINVNSKLLMNPAGTKPANPFPDERSFEDSLMINFYPVPGHQGRFVASHAIPCLGVIIDYQNNRRRRPWVPGVLTPGKPNDYINLFLEETKLWIRDQFTLENISAAELLRREKFLEKLKNDNYYWCFPLESEQLNIHSVIDFVHDKVKEAHEVVAREERNKSLQTLFNELNDNTNNLFGFGKQFLAYLLCAVKKLGYSVDSNSTSNVFDGQSLEAGKLHRLIEQVTRPVFEAYKTDMDRSNQTLQNGLLKALEDKALGAAGNEIPLIANKLSLGGRYELRVKGYESNPSPLQISSPVYLLQIEDPRGNKWIVKKTFTEYDTLHQAIQKEEMINVGSKDSDTNDSFDDLRFSALVFPTTNKMSVGSFLLTTEFKQNQALALDQYVQLLALRISRLQQSSKEILAKFIDTEVIISSAGDDIVPLVHAERVSNAFSPLLHHFQSFLMSSFNPTQLQQDGNGSNASLYRYYRVGSADFEDLRRQWGAEFGCKILECYALLQRIATVLGWTLEINHFFVAMFGNTLTFSKLPLRDILMTQKEMVGKFAANCAELYAFAVRHNAELQYKWHKNLQMAEHMLNQVKLHADKAIAVINTIQTEHLDYQAQMRRLKDVYDRFQPLLNRVDQSLPSIREEVGLFVTPEMVQYQQAAPPIMPLLLTPAVDSTADEKVTFVADSTTADAKQSTAVVALKQEDKSIFSRSGSEAFGGVAIDRAMTSITNDHSVNTTAMGANNMRDESNSAVCIIM